MPENWSWRERAITDTQMRQRDVVALEVKYTKELADAKAENDALRDDAVAGRRRLHIKSSLSVSAWSYHRLAWIMQPPRLADTAERIISPPSERPITMQKQLEGTQKYINGAVELPISMGNSCNYCEQYTRASSGV